jgi:hypothetical protein
MKSMRNRKPSLYSRYLAALDRRRARVALSRLAREEKSLRKKGALRGWVARFFAAPALHRPIESPRPQGVTWKQFCNPIMWLLWSLRFTWQWILSRPYLSLGPAIPAIVLGAAVVLIGVTHKQRGKSLKRDAYRGMLQQAMASEDYTKSF